MRPKGENNEQKLWGPNFRAPGTIHLMVSNLYIHVSSEKAERESESSVVLLVTIGGTGWPCCLASTTLV